MEDLFITRLYSSGVLRYAETNSDIDGYNKTKYTKKGPNSLGNQDNRRIPIRQRLLHPSMLGYIDIAETSNTDPGQGGSLSPYCDMTSMYFDDSLYENEMHYKISKYFDECLIDDECDEIVIKCDNETQYNEIVDKLFHANEGKLKLYGVSNNPMEIVVEKDVREGYRQFDESNLMTNKDSEENK